jgi:hypothetical protein
LQFAGTGGYAAPLIALNQCAELLELIRAGVYPPLPDEIMALLPDAPRPLSYQDGIHCDVYSTCASIWEVVVGMYIGSVPGFLLLPGATEEEQQQYKGFIRFGNPWSASVGQALMAAMLAATPTTSDTAEAASRQLARLVLRGLRSQGKEVTLPELQAAARGLAEALAAERKPQPELLEPEVVEA